MKLQSNDKVLKSFVVLSRIKIHPHSKGLTFFRKINTVIAVKTKLTGADDFTF